MGSQEMIEVVAYQARLYNNPTLLCIEVDDLVEVSRHIDDNTGANHLPCQGCPGGSGNQRSPVFGCKPDQSGNVFFGLGEGHRYRDFPVSRSVSGVKSAGCKISEKFSFEGVSKHAKVHVAKIRH